MSDTELADLEALLERVLPDPRGFTERVLQQVMDRLATDVPAAPQPTVVPSYDSGDNEALDDRNVLLAAALGACECWGQDQGCWVCAGEGLAGWMQPDPVLFEEYVEPAVRRMAKQAAIRGQGEKGEQSEVGEQA